MELLRSRIEKDFEQFIRGIVALDGASFYGLCRVLCINVYEKEAELKEQARLHFGKEKEEMTEEEIAEQDKKVKDWAAMLSKEYPPRPMEEIMNDIMDKFLSLDKKKRREILGVLKDYKRGV